VGNTSADYRVSTYVTVYGENMVMRILRSSGGIKNIEQISMSRGVLERFKHEALDVPTGVILITGPTGSGKTSTLYAAVDYLNRPTTKIITVEDPVEYIVPGIMQCSIDAAAGRSFDQSLKAMMRQDPDIIMIGEIRDLDTATHAIQAALTGHLVFSTLHTNDAVSTIIRLEELGLEPFLISSTLLGALAQRLVRKICPHCIESYHVEVSEIQKLGFAVSGKDRIELKRGKGCKECRGTGYSGRLGVFEIFPMSDKLKKLVSDKATDAELRQVAIREGMTTLREDAWHKVRSGLTTLEEALRVTGDM